jgi:hypothetical protein
LDRPPRTHNDPPHVQASIDDKLGRASRIAPVDGATMTMPPTTLRGPLVWHLKSLPHERPAPHIDGHAPPHPSDPQSLPLHCGVQHDPDTVHVCPAAHPQSAGQLLQVSPCSHAPLPQKTSPLQRPSRHDAPGPHGPQVPPHPSDPHCLPAQVAAGSQQVDARQRRPVEHTQSNGQLEQSSFSVGSQDPLPQEGMSTHCPPSHKKPLLQPGAQLPPQPSSPQVLPVQFGTQHAPRKQAWPLHPQSAGQVSQVSAMSQRPFPQ